MKKISLLLLALGLMISAQAQTTVYFGNLDGKVSVGVGIPVLPSPYVTLSIMQIDKSKNFEDFRLKAVNMEGEEIELKGLEPDTIYHLDMDKSYSHQLDYKVTRLEYGRLCQVLNNTSTTVYVNNVEYTGAAFVGILRALEHEQTMMFSGRPKNFQNMTLWSWGRVEFMRFRTPDMKKGKDFRYIRRSER